MQLIANETSFRDTRYVKCPYYVRYHNKFFLDSTAVSESVFRYNRPGRNRKFSGFINLRIIRRGLEREINETLFKMTLKNRIASSILRNFEIKKENL